MDASLRKKIAIVTSAYNEADCIDELARRLRAVFATLPGYDFEVIMVENGSTDETFERMQHVHENDGRFKIVQLARNFRMDGGLTAGLDYVDGDAVVLMAADLQDPPELIPAFIERWEEGYENVYGMVTARHGTGPVRRANSRAFYWLMGKLSDQVIPRNASDFRLLDRVVYRQVREMDERNRFVRGLVAWAGFRSIGVEFERPERFAGESKAYSLHVVQLAMRALFAHSMRPLLLLPLMGVGLFLLSILAFIGLVANWIFNGVPFPGFGTIITVVVMMFGVLFVFLGVLGFYVGLIYEEVRRRPNYIARLTVGIGEAGLGSEPSAHPEAGNGVVRALTSRGRNASVGQPSGPIIG